MGLKNTYQTRKRFTKVPVSKTGMWYQDGDVVVPSNQITMKGPNGEPNYFNSPIMGTGMQSGQTQVMYPGREYSFPNDNSVYETKMQSGGINLTEEISSLNPNYRKSNFKNILNTADIVTDAMQMGHFISHPIGQAVGYIGDALGAGIDIAQSGINIAEGDYKGAVTNAALGILPGVTGKQGYKRSNSLINHTTSGTHRPLTALPHLRNNPVVQRGLMWNRATLGANAAEIGSNLNFNNNKDNIFGGYQDNTQLAPTVRPVKPKMQGGGETSTAENPERINPVYIEKSKSFFDKAAGKYRNFMRSFLNNDVGRNLYLNYTTAKDAVGMVTNPITKTIGETIPKDFLFNRVRPVDYPESNPLLFAFDAYMRLGDKGAPPLKDAEGNYAPSEEIWRKALGYNDSFNYIEPSQYKPSKTKENDNAEYVRFKNLYDPQKIINAYVKAQKTLPSDKTSTVIPSLDPYITNRENLEASGLAFSQQDPLQNFTLDKGQDEKGKYISLYDKYDFSGPANNLIYGFRKPIEIYDRMYYEKDKSGRPVYKKEKGGLQMSYLKTKRFK